MKNAPSALTEHHHTTDTLPFHSDVDNGEGAKRTLHPHHLTDLRRSGLTEATIAALGFYSVTSDEAAAILGFDPCRDCLAFPFPSRNGQKPFVRLKPDVPFVNADGKPAKYLSPKGADNRLYLAPATRLVLGDAGKPLIVTEGEKKAAKADQDGFPCIGLTGVSCWRQRPRDKQGEKIEDAPGEPIPDLDLVACSGRCVYLCFDSDVSQKVEVKRELWSLRCELVRRGAIVRVVYLPEGDNGAKVGLDDFLIAHGPEALRRLLDAAPALDWLQRVKEVAAKPDDSERDDSLRRLVADAKQNGDALTTERLRDQLVSAGLLSKSTFNGLLRESDTDDDDSPRRSAADRLVDYAHEALDCLFVDQFGAAHVLVGGQPLSLNSRCYKWLRRLLWQEENRSARGEDLSQTAAFLAAEAEATDDVRELHVRSAWHDESLFVELREGRVVRVDASGWRIDEEPPVLFRRIVNLKPLPDPESGGNLDALTSLFPLKTEDGKRRLTAYIVTGLLPHIARPILQATGGGGSGKTTLLRMIKRLLDPTTPESIRLDPRDALQKASHCAVVFLDNVTSLPDWAADSVCRWVTGEGDSKRRLYTDDDDVIFEIQRLVLVSGINPPADRPDFLDRCLCVELSRIPKEERKPEKELWGQFRESHGLWLGAIFDILSKAIVLYPTQNLQSLPRLADWGLWAASAYDATGSSAQTFLSDWNDNEAVQHQTTFDSSSFAQELTAFMADREEWTGTSTDLLTELQSAAKERNLETRHDRTFPKNGVWVSRRLRELVPALSENGLTVSFPLRGKGRDLTIGKGPTNTDDTDDTDGSLAGQGFSRDGNDDSKPDHESTDDVTDAPKALWDKASDSNVGNDSKSGDSSEDDAEVF